MKELLNYIFNNNIPLTILVILAILVFIIEVKKNSDSIKSICVGIYKFFKNKVFRAISNYKRKKYNKCVSTIEFLKWQKEVLDKIYGPIIKKYTEENSKIKCDYADVHGQKYEAIYFKSNNDIIPPFKELFDKEQVKYNNFDKKRLKEIKNGATSYQKKYYKLVKPKIHYPYNVGYMLRDFNLNNKNTEKDSFYFTAETGVYLENVYESNILEYELYRLYKKKKDKILTKSADAILDNLPQRKAIHQCFIKNNEKTTDILTSGKGRKSLLSVSMMVLCKNKNNSYDVLRIRRSENVDAKVGFLQFVPSGGFSALDAGLDFDSQFANASITKGLLREFLEECFGEDDYSGVVNHSPEDVYSNEIVKKIGLDNIHFLGTALSLVSLRHELCFLMKIDNEEVISKMKANDESDNTLHYIDIEKLTDKKFWKRYSLNDERDLLMLNATSAALYSLAKENNFYKNIIEPDTENNNQKTNKELNQ